MALLATGRPVTYVAIDYLERTGKSKIRASDFFRIFKVITRVMMRFRPILMTTMAALLGGLPLALGTGTGSELRRPLGITIVGGFILSQILTLYTTPVVYLYLDKLRSALVRKRAAGRVVMGPATT